ncbi:hypothetical protein [Chitinophaga sp. Cy-1792]|uniref:glycine-rich domain-containing protein n=1 Tax=Chitinophaga sp. Cy-1792 TaxID=2608339 RepID=UPI001420CD13|nr:hypothetical protein [Chitinophaga sp. Cy-1792]NIG52062.1 hypothetical protein [Chitinophaga sp. Cy-1792]
MMTNAEDELWNKLQAFQFDEPDTSFTFVKRLARDNYWNDEFARRVLEEYRRFLFLCITSNSGVTPSDQVDQAWHLHLSYTDNYWNKLCRETLQKELHHNPTKGGTEENDKYADYYDLTLQQYEAKFGTLPPPDIWPKGDERFSDIDFVRINRRHFRLARRIHATAFPHQMLVASILTGFFLCMIFRELIILPLSIVPWLLSYLANHFSPHAYEPVQPSNAGGSGCGTNGCSGDGHHSGHGCSGHGCSSHGCSSGCSSSGCSGCSSGCGSSH